MICCSFKQFEKADDLLNCNVYNDEYLNANTTKKDNIVTSIKPKVYFQKDHLSCRKNGIAWRALLLIEQISLPNSTIDRRYLH